MTKKEKSKIVFRMFVISVLSLLGGLIFLQYSMIPIGIILLAAGVIFDLIGLVAGISFCISK